MEAEEIHEEILKKVKDFFNLTNTIPDYLCLGRDTFHRLTTSNVTGKNIGFDSGHRIAYNGFDVFVVTENEFIGVGI